MWVSWISTDHTLKLCLQNRYLSDRARGNVMRLSSHTSGGCSTSPPHLTLPTDSSPALMRLSASQAGARAPSATHCSARQSAFRSVSGSHRSGLRPGRRRTSSTHLRASASVQLGRMGPQRKTGPANAVLPVSGAALLEGFGLQQKDVLEAQLRVGTSRMKSNFRNGSHGCFLLSLCHQSNIRTCRRFGKYSYLKIALARSARRGLF